jgi:hypothetical protein
MRKELDSNLTKDQIARLKEMDERRQEMMRQERERRKNDTVNFRDSRQGPSHRGGDERDFQGPPPPHFGGETDSSGSTGGK